jgi:hypothetical protein
LILRCVENLDRAVQCSPSIIELAVALGENDATVARGFVGPGETGKRVSERMGLSRGTN